MSLGEVLQAIDQLVDEDIERVRRCMETALLDPARFTARTPDELLTRWQSRAILVGLAMLGARQ